MELYSSGLFFHKKSWYVNKIELFKIAVSGKYEYKFNREVSLKYYVRSQNRSVA